MDAIRDIKAGRTGEVYSVAVPPVAQARQKSGLSQTKFADLLGVSVRTLQDWEQGRRQPSRAEASLVRIANLLFRRRGEGFSILHTQKPVHAEPVAACDRKLRDAL